ncbi:hypothetical protein FRC08_017411 [Ceratobasidium sp. 394]|nr:hypothetical protein FRC08_017411 [Ceratobasidium sp. 394]
MYCRLSHLPLDLPVPAFTHFRTSELPDLLCDGWLSDEHMNAGCQLLNAHPSRVPQLQILNTYFLRYLELNFERSTAWAPRRPFGLDTLIAGGVVDQLFIPVYLPSHWALLYIDISLERFAYIDTLDLEGSQPPSQSLDHVNRWLSCVLGRNILLDATAPPFSVGEQLDSNSCGVAVLSSIAHHSLATGCFPSWTQETALEHRLQWALLLSNMSTDELATPTVRLEDLIGDDLDPLESTPSLAAEDSEPDDDAGSLSEPSLPPCSPIPAVRTHTLVQSTLPFKRITRQEYEAQETRRYNERKEEKLDYLERIGLLQAQKQVDQRRYERLRKREQRERHRVGREELGMRAKVPKHSDSPISLSVKKWLPFLAQKLRQLPLLPLFLQFKASPA